jgi:E2/UBC family protein E
VSIALAHLEQLRREYPEAQVELRPDGTALVTVPSVQLGPGWNQSTVTLTFVAPVGYPMAQPDCFWADEALRLAEGSMPKNAAVQTPPFGGSPKVWFSWHVSGWSASRDSLRSYLRIIMNRLSRAE